MATTNNLVPTSSSLRRLIAAAAARLQRALANHNANGPSSTPTDEADLLVDQFDELEALHKAILKPYSRLQQLHTQWLRLMDNNDQEKAVFHDFLTHQGDYMELLTRAVSTLEHMDSQLHTLETTATALKVTIPSSPAHSIIDEAFLSSPNDDVHSVFIKTPQPNAPHPVNNFGSYPATDAPMATAPSSTVPVMTASNPELFGPSIPTRSSSDILHGYSPHVQIADTNALSAALISRLDVPSFDGSIVDFPEFWTRFSTLVDNRQGLDPGSKFSLLKSCLSGPAHDNIHGIPVTGDNYTIAVAILHSTYNQPSVLKHLLYSRLIALPSCDETTLRQRFSQMNALVRQLTSLDRYTSSEYGLATALINKLPREIRGRVLDKTPAHSNLTPSQLMDILGDIVRKEFRLDSMTSSTDVFFSADYHSSGRPPPDPDSQSDEEDHFTPGSVADDDAHNHISRDITFAR